MAMKIYSVQILMGFGFLGELILNGVTSWTLFFVVMLFIIGVLNFIQEIKKEA